MDQLQLRPMTVAEFETYQARLVPGYAAEHVRAGDWTADEAEALAAGQVNDLLPAGPDSPGMLLHQGKGYGRALLQAAEQQAARHGSKAIGLNVFGTNTVARRLYESSGYQITSMNMRKELGAT
jgi:GNAT superfamily N-acetyltransferase